MAEYAFKVKKDSKIYADYFTQKNEEDKCHDLAREFFFAHFDNSKRQFRMEKNLMCSLSKEEVEKYRDQLKKSTLGESVKGFLARAPMNKLWQKEVYGNIDPNKLKANYVWWSEFLSVMGILGGIEYSMWDNGEGEVYGLLISKYPPSHPELPDSVEQIKMSEYYGEIERIEAAKKAAKLSS